MNRYLYTVMIWAALLGGNCLHGQQTNGSGHLIVSFPSDNKMLLGYWFRPNGAGPFPGVIFHHIGRTSLTSQDLATWQPLANLLTSHGYILFLPDRHSDVLEKQEYSPALQTKMRMSKHDSTLKGELMIEREDLVHRDVTAALEWFRRNPEVDKDRIAIGGYFGGAIHTLYDVEKLPNVRSLFAFSPGVVSWDNNPVVRGMLTASVRKANAPIFLLYADNQNLAPAETLSQELDQKGKPNQVKIYPAPEKTGEKSTNLFADGINMWGPDVLKFLEQTMK